MKKFIYADPLQCSGCRICEIVCSFEKEKVYNPRKSRIRVVRTRELIDLPIACVHCYSPQCARVCPVNAIEEDEIVKVIAERCIGCGLCVEACIIGAIDIHPDGYAYICDLCGVCVEKCPNQALKIVTPSQVSQRKQIEYLTRMLRGESP